MSTKLEYVLKPVAELTANPRNARTHSKDQIKKLSKSIKEYGFINPIIIDKEGVLIAGHGRLAAAKLLKMESVPCLLAEHLTPIQIRGYMLADNRLAMDAGWDEDILRLELNELSELDFDLDLTGFDVSEVGSFVRSKSEKEEIEDEVSDVPETPKTVLGDIWILGNHRVMCGDSTDHETVAKLMNGQKADMVFTDPPYNIAYEGGSKKRKMIQNDKRDDFYSFLLKAYSSAFSVMRPGAAIYVTHADTERVNFTSAFIAAGFHLSSVIIWAKNNATFGRQDYFWKHEPMLYGWHSGGPHEWFGPNTEDTVWQIDRPSKSEEHPTMKPVALVERAILNSSREGQTVLDLFGGSGSTLIAAQKTGRIARLMELDPQYVDVIVKRWQDYTGLDAVHAETGKTYNAL